MSVVPLRRRHIIQEITSKNPDGTFKPFAVRFVTYDQKRKNASGKLRTYENCTFAAQTTSSPSPTTNSVSTSNPSNAYKKITVQLPDGSIRKIWYHLITRINNRPIVP